MNTLPSGNVTGPKGDPEANTDRPLVQVYACSAVHSAFEVGLERANTNGLLFSDAISSTISLVNELPCALTPESEKVSEGEKRERYNGCM